MKGTYSARAITERLFIIGWPIILALVGAWARRIMFIPIHSNVIVSETEWTGK
jgi:hypothetical protein